MKCSNCEPGHCDPLQAIIIDDLPCPECHGHNPTCRRCNGRGTFVASGCPRQYVDPQSLRAMRLASFAEKGILPASGGLDQQRYRDVVAINAVWAETAAALSEDDG